MGLHMNWGLPRRAAPIVVAAAFVFFSHAFSLTANQAFADAAFQRWLGAIWPEAEAMGMSRATFDTATRGLEPDLSLPDLACRAAPRRRRAGRPSRADARRLSQGVEYLASRRPGREAARAISPTLDGIEQRFGVPGNVVLAIWGRETDFGNYKLPHNAIRVLATQAYVGKRKAMFRNEFLLALKMLQDGAARRRTCAVRGAARSA